VCSLRPAWAIATAAALLCSSHAAGADDGGARNERAFLDRSGHWRSFDDSYRDWFAPERRPAHYMRAAGEAVLLVGLGTAYYWVDPLANAADWDFPTFGAKLRFEAVRFDNNLHATNHVLHPLAGAAVYGFSRVNGLEPWESFGYALASSLVWEYGLEFREQVSINDLVFTPIGGVAVGEFMVQLGDYLNSAPGGGAWGNKIAASTLGLPRNMHDAFDEPSPPTELPADELGFSSAYWHRFLIGYRVSSLGNDRERTDSAHGSRVEAEIVAMPGFQRPGTFSKAFAGGNFSEMRWTMDFGGRGLADADLFFLSSIAGAYRQDFAAPGLSGDAEIVALSTGLRFSDRRLMGRFDRFGIAHVLGPRLGAWLGSGRFLARVDSSAHFDFAGIHPIAFEEWSRDHVQQGLKSVLSRQGYQYALGFSVRLSTRIEFAGLRLGTRASYGRYDSVEGLDREQDQVTRDVPTRDEVIELGSMIGYSSAWTPVDIELSAAEMRRAGTMADHRVSLYDRKLSLTLGLEL